MTGIGLNEIVSKLEHKTKAVLVLLDACFSSPEIMPETSTSGQKGLGIAPKFAQEKAVVMAGSSSTQPSLDFDMAGHGYFSYYFILGLKGEADKNSDGAVTDTELCEYVQAAMAKADYFSFSSAGASSSSIVRTPARLR